MFCVNGRFGVYNCVKFRLMIDRGFRISIFGLEICSSNHSIILCCENNRAIITGSLGNGWALALIALAYL